MQITVYIFNIIQVNTHLRYKIFVLSNSAVQVIICVYVDIHTYCMEVYKFEPNKVKCHRTYQLIEANMCTLVIVVILHIKTEDCSRLN